MSTDNTATETLEAAERDRLAYAIETRFAAPRDDAAAAVRAAERLLEEARAESEAAQAAAESARYRSDPLVFMRDGLAEEVDGLERKTNPKKVRASYRFLMDRAVELAGAEVRGFHDDRAAEEHERLRGVAASAAAIERAEAAVQEALAMQDRVARAERAARKGLAVLFEKFDNPEG